MIVIGAKDDRRIGPQDILPTLCDLACVATPDTVEGRSMISGASHDHFYGEFDEDGYCSRMTRGRCHELINHPVGNVFQLFYLQHGPADRARRRAGVSSDPAAAPVAAARGVLRNRTRAGPTASSSASRPAGSARGRTGRCR